MPLPISLRLDGRRAVIVGGGAVAYRKTRALATAGAQPCVISPLIDDRLRELIAKHGGEAIDRRYETGDLKGADFVVVATDDEAVNAAVASDAQRERVLCCDATAAGRGDVIMPAIARAGNVTIAVDTGGEAPALAQRIARELRLQFGSEYGRAAANMARMRKYAKIKLPVAERGRVMRALAELPIDELATMDQAAAERAADAAIAEAQDPSPHARSSAVCASRASALAMTQSRTVAAALAQRGIVTTITTITTTGDRDRDRPLHAIGENVFVKELQSAVRDGRADYAVHSCKDLSSTPEPDLQIVAISAREDARDVFCSERYAHFADLPPGARVGTSSPRRRAQLTSLRPDLRYDNLRGNVDTRLRKLHDGQYDAIVLASAGLKRLRASATHVEPFGIDEVVPAAGQGALAIEVRAGNDELGHALRAAVNDDLAELCVTCERAALRALHAGCSAPIGVHAEIQGESIDVRAFFAAEPDKVLRARLREPAKDLAAAERLGERLAAQLRDLIDAPSVVGRILVLPRTQHRSSRIAMALRAAGAHVFELRDGEAAPEALGERVPDMLLFPSSGCVAAARPFLERLQRVATPAIAVMGPESASAARRAGFEPDVVAANPSVDEFVSAVVAYFGNGAPHV